MLSIFSAYLRRWLSPLGNIFGWFGLMFEVPPVDIADEPEEADGVFDEEESSDEVLDEEESSDEEVEDVLDEEEWSGEEAEEVLDEEESPDKEAKTVGSFNNFLRRARLNLQQRDQVFPPDDSEPYPVLPGVENFFDVDDYAERDHAYNML